MDDILDDMDDEDDILDDIFKVALLTLLFRPILGGYEISQTGLGDTKFFRPTWGVCSISFDENYCSHLSRNISTQVLRGVIFEGR